jgi:PilZ domain
MPARSVPAWEFNFIRKSPRMRFIASVEILFDKTVFAATSHSLSVGGMLLETSLDLPLSTKLHVHFPLPNGIPVLAEARVIYCRPGAHIGIEFMNLANSTRDELRDAIKARQTGRRRSIRIPERFFVHLQWDEEGAVIEQTAQTVLLSRHGCLLLTKAAPEPSTQLLLRWPEAGTDATARVVSRQPDLDGLFKTAVEFAEDSNFWGIDFEAEKAKLICDSAAQ